MPLNLTSPRQRAISRRSLAILMLAVALTVAILMVPAMTWKGHPPAGGAKAAGAPPEAATRPNPATEPLRGPGRD